MGTAPFRRLSHRQQGNMMQNAMKSSQMAPLYLPPTFGRMLGV